jgi:hypothetical protein
MFTLPPLPFAENALDPVISANTLSFHYGKHHRAYVDNLNNLAKGTEYESAPLEKVIRDTAGKPDKMGLFNNSAQVWNHTFYLNSFGVDVVTAITTAYKIDTLTILPIINISVAISIFVGQNVGAYNMERAKEGLKKGNIIILFVAIAVTTVVVLGGEVFMKFFGVSDELHQATASCCTSDLNPRHIDDF